MDRKIKSYNIAFYAIVAAGFVFILFTNPFLVRMYDPWRYHLKNIADLYNGVGGEGRIWHLMWANVFKLLGISDIFSWAKIIHVTQFFLSAFLVYYFSKTALTILINIIAVRHRDITDDESSPPLTPFNEAGPRELSDEKEIIRIKFVSLFSVLLWFIGNGTFSVQYQQAWIMWYSVTYQGLTMPLFLYATALTLRVFYAELSFKKIILYIIQIAVTSVIIAKFHPLELLFYLINLSIILLINIRRILHIKSGKFPLISAVVICILLTVTVKYFLQHQPTPFYALISSNESAGRIIEKITGSGRGIVRNLNRFPNSFSELAQISLILAVIFRIYWLFAKGTKISFNKNLFDCLLVLSIIFFLIPMVPFLAGVAGYLTVDEQVYRFFYAPPWFVFLPFIIYLSIKKNLISKIKYALSNNIFYRMVKEKEIEIPKRKVIIDFIAAGLALSILFAVLHSNTVVTRNNIFRLFMFNTTTMNIKSIINSLDKNKVGMQYPQDDMEKLIDNRAIKY
jgi:hypothetical protein